ncbi:saccharopine dehydrogenase NADP-binding domain-containing protein [Oceaniradius stylonematis]|uniref:saccharopine dehydrogenase NADP-binding domain-containing protein n=1 Tax=Oceaniradius stylonematis TaxID=2184161 RepID=UPI00274028CE|nr:saccharopine dehydrogenase NADP-binding domain-containing protein [Oceaniradius stylonematis]
MVTAPRKTILVLGAGVIGGNVADLLTRMDDRFRVILAARDAARVGERANLAITVALNLGFEPQLEWRSVDVTDLDATASLIAETAPDLIVNATSLQTFWAISLLPGDIHKRLERAKIGPWLPNHLATTRAVMRAVADSGTAAPVVNGSFPDGVNPALATVGLAPLVGGGNIANLIPTLERACAEMLGVDRRELTLRFAAHHVACNAISSTGKPDPAPYALSVRHGGREVADEIDQEALFASVVGKFKRVRGVAGQVVASSGIAAVAAALLDDEQTHRIHVPGPNGLAGGYPAHVGSEGVALDCAGGFDQDKAVAVNTQGAHVEGIEDIRPDGTIVFAEEEMSVLTETFGYRCREMHVDDVDAAAADLQARYRSFASELMQ